jgi:hypothetical protein
MILIVITPRFLHTVSSLHSFRSEMFTLQSLVSLSSVCTVSIILSVWYFVLTQAIVLAKSYTGLTVWVILSTGEAPQNGEGWIFLEMFAQQWKKRSSVLDSAAVEANGESSASLPD